MTAKSPLSLLAGSVALLAITACGGENTSSTAHDTTKPAEKPAETTVAPTETAAAATPGAILDTVLAGDHRSDGEKARDAWRHPKETLLFFGVEPTDTVAELFPGGGWYTKVLAPYLTVGGGQYVAVNFNPGDNERRIERLKAFEEAFSDKDVYGNFKVGLIGQGATMIEPGTADVVLTFRNVHNWMAGGVTDEFFAEFYKALKPGGVLGVVEHRADASVEQDPQARSGYVREDFVIAAAEKAGFEFDSKSEINANPKDTRDHPFGVWTLPPVKRSSSTREPDPDFDRTKYDAIGESDRMTLKFRKPVGADGALLE